MNEEDNCWKEFNELRKRDDQEQRDATKKDYWTKCSLM